MNNIEVGDYVRVFVDMPTYGWGSVNSDSTGIITEMGTYHNDTSRIPLRIDFPEHNRWNGYLDEIELVRKGGHMFKIGDEVSLHPDVHSFTFGKGYAEHGEVGKVVDINEYDSSFYEVLVRFEGSPYQWRGLDKELVLIRRCSKSYWKNMTGQINQKVMSPIFERRKNA